MVLGHVVIELARNGLPKDTTAVINVAGQNILDPTRRWTTGFRQNVWNSRVETTKALSRAVTFTDAKKFVNISGVAYYPPNGKEYTEDDKCKPYDYLSELCHAWEAAAKLPDGCKTNQVTIRSGVVLGRTGGMIAQTIWPFFFGLGGPLGSGEQFMPWIHIEDLVYLFIWALRNDVGPVLNGVAPQLVRNKEFAKAFASAMWRPAIIPLPKFVLNLIFNEERAKIMTEGQKVLPKRVLESGFEFEYPDIKKACTQVAQLVYNNPL
ncbi:epimerase family protein SDR39U1 isoform X2 [Venturia canescens]|uniref:epimerase family protein SDR39U1 isoform X2 n=1 Tax=Venturia canescens TaxID=32260 RepID=UPI001C9CB89F|nr:epimerase family protein SDR39U1 isoform X2 [Venturia canescens]